MRRLTTALQNRVARFALVCAVVSASSLIATAGWSQTLTWLGTLPGGSSSVAYGVSADGSVVVGRASNAAAQDRAFRWQNNAMQDLGTLPNHNGSYASGVSADGNVVVGSSYLGGVPRAFRWTQMTGMQNISPPGSIDSDAFGVSATGGVVVGRYRQPPPFLATIAFRWQNGVVQNLGSLGGDYSVAYGVSADGLVVVGRARNATGQDRASRWTQAGGIEDLNQTYASLLTPGSVLQEARAISPDGRYIVGSGFNATTGRSEGFLLDTIPEPASLMTLGVGLAGLLGLRRRKR